MLREPIVRVLSEYSSAKRQLFDGHPLANSLRHDFPSQISSLIPDKKRYISRGSAGMAKWTDCPWVATLNTLVTTSPQRGFYMVYLFREDMAGVYLSLNQGITDLRNAHGVAARDILVSHGTLYRSQLYPIPSRCSLRSIDLATTSPSTRSAFYESGNVCAVYYDRNNVPTDDVLISDYNLLLSLYERLIQRQNLESAAVQLGEEGSKQGQFIEDLANLRMHERIDRNPKLSAKVKSILGYTCQACGFNYSRVYGPLGVGFIEAHHLVPLSQLKGQIICLDPSKDFAVLCSNCHGMIHKFEKPHDVQAFKTLLRTRIAD
ncbi:MrcB family domain-containing protein [Chloroflexota bacterium]